MTLKSHIALHTRVRALAFRSAACLLLWRRTHRLLGTMICGTPKVVGTSRCDVRGRRSAASLPFRRRRKLRALEGLMILAGDRARSATTPGNAHQHPALITCRARSERAYFIWAFRPGALDAFLGKKPFDPIQTNFTGFDQIRQSLGKKIMNQTQSDLCHTRLRLGLRRQAPRDTALPSAVHPRCSSVHILELGSSLELSPSQSSLRQGPSSAVKPGQAIHRKKDYLFL
jgi:hypothetical protein